MNQSCQIIKLEETESTNTYLKNILAESSIGEFTVVSTNFQTKGRGQMGNSWISNRGENLLFSMLIYPHTIKANEQFVISQVVSVALANVLSKYVCDIKIKWPNDIYWKDNKIAGILIENSLLGHHIERSIIGIGLNINQNTFPNFLVNPISLQMITGHKYDLDDILSQFMDEFLKQYEVLCTGNWEVIENAYMKLLYRYGDGICYTYEDEYGQFDAKIIEVKKSGHLVLRAQGEGEDRIYAFKEVRFIN